MFISNSNDNLQKYSWEERVITRQAVQDRYQDMNEIDVNSEEFCSLPLEIQHEILIEMKERKKLRYIDTETLPEVYVYVKQIEKIILQIFGFFLFLKLYPTFKS